MDPYAAPMMDEPPLSEYILNKTHFFNKGPSAEGLMCRKTQETEIPTYLLCMLGLPKGVTVQNVSSNSSEEWKVSMCFIPQLLAHLGFTEPEVNFMKLSCCRAGNAAPPLWVGLKYLNSHETGCYQILCRHLCSP